MILQATPILIEELKVGRVRDHERSPLVLAELYLRIQILGSRAKEFTISVRRGSRAL
jgi:hypothetical protein